jgi:nucleoside-diphosphate-sugar epimerase
MLSPKVVNVGNIKEVTIVELAEKVKQITKCRSTIEFCPLPKDGLERRFLGTKLERLVGWKPNVGFECYEYSCVGFFYGGIR